MQGARLPWLRWMTAYEQFSPSQSRATSDRSTKPHAVDSFAPYVSGRWES